MERVGNDLALKVKLTGIRQKHFRVPGDISAFDVPYWFSSVLKTSAPTVDGTALGKCEAKVRMQTPSKGGLTTICVGPKDEFHRCQLLHIDPKNVILGCHGSTLAISAPIQGLRFTKGSLIAVWTVIFRTSSKRRAQALQKQILGSNETLLSLDHYINGIMAFNSQRWECAGMTVKDVMKFAADQKLSLRPIDTDSPGLALALAAGMAPRSELTRSAVTGLEGGASCLVVL